MPARRQDTWESSLANWLMMPVSLHFHLMTLVRKETRNLIWKNSWVWQDIRIAWDTYKTASSQAEPTSITLSCGVGPRHQYIFLNFPGDVNAARPENHGLVRRGHFTPGKQPKLSLYLGLGNSFPETNHWELILPSLKVRRDASFKRQGWHPRLRLNHVHKGPAPACS